MERIERYVKEVCRGLRVPESLRQQIGQELRAHLLESVQAHVDAGMAEEEAVAAVLAEFGQAEVVRGELRAVYGGGLLTLLIQHAMDWKEKTMKTGWKWGFVAQAALVMGLAVGYFALVTWAKFIIPMVVQGHRELAEPATHLRGLATVLVSFARLMHDTWLLWPILLALGWGVFEWRCRSESKGTIRFATGAVACLAMTAVVCVASTMSMIMSTDLMVNALSQRDAAEIRRADVPAELRLADPSQASAPSAR